MKELHNKKLDTYARQLRKNMTEEERKLWYCFLKGLPVTIKRQKVLGNCIVDFYCASASIVIEIDGWQHYEDEGREKDKIRDLNLLKNGIKVLRYSNYDINKNFDVVCEDIYNNIFLCK